jgi:hypothetical protein
MTALTAKAQEAILREVPHIESALIALYAALDLGSYECEACHSERKVSFRDHQLAENLRSIRHKIRRWETECGGRPTSSEREWRSA